MSAIGRPSEIRALSGARALPPLVLVLFHFCEQRGYFGVPALDALVGKGYLWVEFFFALSGFVLIHVHGAEAKSLFRVRGLLIFLQKRLARLYPLHLATLLLLAAIVGVTRAMAPLIGQTSIFDQPYHPIVSAGTFVANLFLVQAWNLFGYLSWNAPAWFVSVEFLLCILFPIYAVLARGGRRRGILLTAAGIAGLASLAATSGVHGLDITFHNGVLRGIAAFAAGVGLAAVFRSIRHADVHLANVWQVGALAGLVFAIWFSGPSRSMNDVLVATMEMALIFALAFDKGVVARVFQTSSLVRLGEWSYAIYLVQYPLLQILRTVRQYYPPEFRVLGHYSAMVHWIEAGVLLAAAIGLGAALTVYVERPVHARLRRLITARA
jgi:peptidoglycan/LPS O-acetylase OafA/YrhL